jgi:putative transposase
MDVVSRRWLSTLVSAEETCVQVEAAFLAALDGEQLTDRIDARLLARLRAGEVRRPRPTWKAPTPTGCRC